MKPPRKSFTTRLWLSGSLLLLLGASPGFADEHEGAGSWNIEISAGVRSIDLPTFDAPIGDTFVLGYPGVISENFQPLLGGGEASLGYTFANGWSLEVGGGYYTGSDSTAATPVFDTGINQYGLSITALDGVNGTLVGASELAGDRVYASVDAKLLETQLRLARNLKSGDTVIRPYIGILHERLTTDYNASFRLVEPAVFLETAYALSEDIESNRTGGEAGLDVILPLRPGLQFKAGAEVAVYSQSSNLKAHDCAATAQFSPGFDCEDSVTTFNYVRLVDTAINENDHRIGYRVKLSSGINYALSFGTIGLSGFAQYDSDVAGVKNPLLTQDQFLNVDPTRQSPAHLFFDDTWSYGGRVLLTIPFN